MFIRTTAAWAKTFAAVLLSISVIAPFMPRGAHAMTASVLVSTDASSPSYRIVAAGTEAVAGVYRLQSVTDPVVVNSVFVSFTSGSFKNVVDVSIYNGATKIGTGYFAGATSTAVVSFTQPVYIPQNGTVALTVKTNLAPIAQDSTVFSSGHLVQINFAGGTGYSTRTLAPVIFSGSTSVAGMRVMKTFPTVSLMPLATTTVQDGRLMRFAISADAHGPVGIQQLAFSISQNPVNSLSSASLYAFTDPSYSLPISGGTSDGLLGAFVVYGSGGVNKIALQPVEIPAGQTRYFELRASVAASAQAVTTKLLGDAGYQEVSQYDPVTWTPNVAWSPNDWTMIQIWQQNWFNGFAIPGLPANGLVFTRTGVTPPAPTCALSIATLNNLGKKTLSWTTTNATDLSIESDSTIYGSVTPVSAGSMTIYVSESEYVTGTVTGPGGTAYCSIFVSGPKLYTKGIIP